jgi:hypothetical protein
MNQAKSGLEKEKWELIMLVATLVIACVLFLIQYCMHQKNVGTDCIRLQFSESGLEKFAVP